MAALPSNLALTNIQDGANIVAADHRNNYSAIQIAVNELITALSGGTAGQLLQALDSADVGWLSLTLQKVSWVGMPTMSATSTTGWLTANAAILVPFTLQQTQTVDRAHFKTSATQSGNFDIGVYDSTGVRKVSKGSTAQSTLTASAVNEVTFASTSLNPGEYYLALACDNTTGTFSFSAVNEVSAKYQLQVATSFPLPASLTPGTTHPTNALPMSAPAT